MTNSSVRRMMLTLALAAAGVSVSADTRAEARSLSEDAPIRCEACDRWNAPVEPFRIYGNTYYVGTADLSAILIVGERGSVLLDGGLPQSASLIAANVAKLGFRVEDIRLILNSHAHFDHAGGIAALQRASGATVAASSASAAVLIRGQPGEDDPQHPSTGFPPVSHVRSVKHRETLLTPHSWGFDLNARLKRRAEDPEVNPFVQPGACKAYAAKARGRLQKRIEEERGGAMPPR